MSQLEWRAVKGFPGYEISSEGIVRSWIRKDVAAKILRKLDATPFFNKISKNSGGFPIVYLYKDGKRLTRQINVLMRDAFGA